MCRCLRQRSFVVDYAPGRKNERSWHLVAGNWDFFISISRRDILNAAKLDLMGKLTYADFRKGYVKADPQLQAYFRQSTAE